MLGTGSSRSVSFSSALGSQVLLRLSAGLRVGGAAGSDNQQRETSICSEHPAPRGAIYIRYPTREVPGTIDRW